MDGICDCDCGAVEPGCGDVYCRELLARCGNGALDPAEECELGGRGCDDACRCRAGFRAAGNVNCEAVCGDGIVVEGEECDGGEGCSDDCRYRSEAGKGGDTLHVVLYAMIGVIVLVLMVFAFIFIFIK